jgi:hypothetical protein
MVQTTGDPYRPFFFFSDPAPGQPPSPQALALRGEIAKAMAAQRYRRPEIKNIGGGILSAAQDFTEAANLQHYEDQQRQLMGLQLSDAEKRRRIAEGGPDTPAAASAGTSGAAGPPGWASSALPPFFPPARNPFSGFNEAPQAAGTAVQDDMPAQGTPSFDTPENTFSDPMGGRAAKGDLNMQPLTNAGRFNPVITNLNSGNSVIAGQLPTSSFRAGGRAYGALPDVPEAPIAPQAGEAPMRLASLGGVPAPDTLLGPAVPSPRDEIQPAPPVRMAQAPSGVTSDVAPLWLRSGAQAAPPITGPAVPSPRDSIKPAPPEVQAGGIPRPLSPPVPQPAPPSVGRIEPTPPFGARTPPTPPPPVPETKRYREFTANAEIARIRGDEIGANGWTALAAREEVARKTLETHLDEKYKSDLKIYEEKEKQDRAHWLASPKTNAELLEKERALQAAIEAEAKYGKGGRGPIEAAVVKSREAVKGIPEAMEAIRESQDMLNKGIYSGTFANFQLLRDKVISGLASGSEAQTVERTERYIASLRRIQNAVRAGIAGTQGQSVPELKAIEQAIALDPKLQASSMKGILAQLHKGFLNDALEHQDKAWALIGDPKLYPNEARTEAPIYSLPMHRIVPQAAVNSLRTQVDALRRDGKEAEAKKVMDEFDDDFNSPGTAINVLKFRR